MKPFKNSTIIKILDYYKNIWALSYVSGIAHWDLETYMPALGAVSRGEALGRISTIKQKMFLDRTFAMLIATADKQKLNDYERGVVRVLQRELKFYTRLPSDFVEKYEKLTNTTTIVWREAKEKDNYEIFEPALSKIFDMNRQMAEYLGYGSSSAGKNSPYDALLDLFEEKLSTRQVEGFFDQIRSPLQKLLKQIINSKKYQKTHWLENQKYDRLKMEELNKKVLKAFWQDNDRFRLDVSTHPFTTSFGVNDTRITTWYHEKDFSRSLLAVIHEFGHALYDLQSNSDLEMTPIAGGSSLVIHESQSRFWENFVGRSEGFIAKFLPNFEEDIYFYLNKVLPSTLRVEADEITYHFHIMLRYEIEKGIIEGKLKTKNLKEIWNSKMKEYLGITPKKDSEGILQDIHWSGGSVGYFPTYSLGTFLSAQWAERIKKEEIIINNYDKTKKWLQEHIHQFGSTYTLEDLLQKNRMKFDPNVNLKYLQEKYSRIYNF